jgi:hypothetical protein
LLSTAHSLASSFKQLLPARLEKAKSNLTNDFFIPHSACVKFAIGTMQLAREAFPNEHTVLQTKVETDLGVFQLTSKENIPKENIQTSLDLELKAIRKDIMKLFCNRVFSLTTCHVIHNPALNASCGACCLFKMLLRTITKCHLKHAGLLACIQFLFAPRENIAASNTELCQVGETSAADKAAMAPPPPRCCIQTST